MGASFENKNTKIYKSEQRRPNVTQHPQRLWAQSHKTGSSWSSSMQQLGHVKGGSKLLTLDHPLRSPLHLVVR